MNSPRSFLIAVLTLVIALETRGLAFDEEEEKAETRVQMRRVWEAIMAFKKDRGQVPDHLSDLIPDYLPNADALIAPKQRRTGGAGDNNYKDPRIRGSFCYEFSALKFAGNTETFRAVKEAQMEEFGGVVPILRCFLYRPRVMSMGYAGDLYESALYWETAPEAKAVTARIGPGPGFKNGEFAVLTAQDAATGAPIAGAEVRVTERMYHFLPLPDRTVVTGADGKVRVPLGPARPPSRQLTVAVSAPGYFALPEVWEEGKLPEEAVIGLERTLKVEGIVKLSEGAALAGAQVEVSARVARGNEPHKLGSVVLATETADAEGRWSCDRVPGRLFDLTIHVRHPSAWTTRLDFPDLPFSKAGVREARVLPAAVQRGVVFGADGKPLAGAEVFAVSEILPPEDGQSAPALAAPPKWTPVKTDAEGRYVIPWCDARMFSLLAFPSVGAPGRVKIESAVELKPRDVRLTAGRTIEGRVLGEDGRPASGVKVSFCGWQGDGLPVEKMVATADADGRFSWAAAPMESVILRFAGDEFFDRCVTAGAEAAEPLSVRMFLRAGK